MSEDYLLHLPYLCECNYLSMSLIDYYLSNFCQWKRPQVGSAQRIHINHCWPTAALLRINCQQRVLNQDIPFATNRYTICLCILVLFRLVLEPEYSGKSKSWLLMYWLLASPGHQQLWNRVCRTKGSSFWVLQGSIWTTCAIIPV